MTKQEKAAALMNDPNVHYGCAQALLMSFAEEIGITEEQAFNLAQNLSGGMGQGYVCGAVTSALIAMGGMGLPQEKRRELIRKIKEEKGCVDCATLLRTAAERGEARKKHCIRMVGTCVDFVCKASGLE